MKTFIESPALSAPEHDLIEARLTPLRSFETRLPGENAKVILLLDIREGRAAFREALPSSGKVLLDNSPSMSGGKLAAAKSAAREAAFLVAPGSALSIDAFDYGVTPLGHVDPRDPSSKDRLLAAIEALGTGDGTSVGGALQHGFDQLRGVPGVKYALVLSDGQTSDEQLCRALAPEYARQGIKIHFLATDDVDIDLARYLTDTTGGRLEYLRDIAGGAQAFFSQMLAKAQSVTVQNVVATVRPAGAARVLMACKAYPDIIQAPTAPECRCDLGDISKGEALRMYVELLVAPPPRDGTVDAGCIDVSFDAPGRGRLSLTVPIRVRFAAGASPQPDPDVLSAMQLVKSYDDLQQASAAPSPDDALAHLASAERRTRIAGDANKTRIIGEMIADIHKTRVVSGDSRKTMIAAGRRTTIGK